MRHALLTLAALAVAASGCSGSEPTATGPTAAPSARLLAATSDSLGAAGPAARQALARRLLQGSGVTPLADMGRRRAANPRFTVGSTTLVAGLVPGRYPLARDELVIVGTSLDGPQAGPVVEAMRVLAERSQWAVVPERTVMVALWTGPDGAREALNSGVWPRSEVRAVLTVGETVAAPDGLETVAIPATSAATAGARLALAQRVLDEAIRLARRPALVDTTR